MELKMKSKGRENQTASPFKYPQGYFKDKKCKRCETMFSPMAPSEHYCCNTCKDDAIKDKYLYRNYGISLESYKKMWADQGNVCAICGDSGEYRATASNSVSLVIDHCHKTGEVRGLLCHTCNSALGQFQDSTEMLLKAVEYLTAKKVSYKCETRKLLMRKQTEIVSNNTTYDVLCDSLDNNLKRKQLVKKYNLTEAKIRGIVELKTQQSKKAYKRYLQNKERATTIPNGSTSQAYGDGSGECPEH